MTINGVFDFGFQIANFGFKAFNQLEKDKKP